MGKNKKIVLSVLFVLVILSLVGMIYFQEQQPKTHKYPKLICRCNSPGFDVYNEEEEIQMKEFLGLDPIGKSFNLYLSELTEEQLVEWRDYWINIWTNLGREDIVDFIHTMEGKPCYCSY